MKKTVRSILCEFIEYVSAWCKEELNFCGNLLDIDLAVKQKTCAVVWIFVCSVSDAYDLWRRFVCRLVVYSIVLVPDWTGAAIIHLINKCPAASSRRRVIGGHSAGSVLIHYSWEHNGSLHLWTGDTPGCWIVNQSYRLAQEMHYCSRAGQPILNDVFIS